MAESNQSGTVTSHLVPTAKSAYSQEGKGAAIWRIMHESPNGELAAAIQSTQQGQYQAVKPR